MKIYDCFLFSNELDILEIRLRYLSPYVDYFVIVESNHTFSGKSKPYNLENNWARFKNYEDKIIYLLIEQDPSNFTFREHEGYDPNDGAFRMEAEARNSLMYINNRLEAEDMAILSDVDEIPCAYVLRAAIAGINLKSFPSPLALPMQFFAYYLNNLTVSGPDVLWKGSIIISAEQWLSTSPQSLRDKRNIMHSPNTRNSFHFSWMNGVEAIKNKIQSFAHTEFDRPHIVNDEAIHKAIEEGKDVLQRPGVSYQLQPMSIFPAELANILKDYPHLIK